MGLYLQRRRPHTLQMTDVASVINTANPATDGSNTNSFTFTNVAIGDPDSNRGIIIGVMGGTSGTFLTPSTPVLTLGGIGMTPVVSIGGPGSGITNGVASIFALSQSKMADPSAIIADIGITFGGNTRGKTISVFRTTGIDLTASDTMTALTVSPLQGTITFPDGGFVLACALHNNSDAGTVWTGVTEHLDAESFGRRSAGYAFPTTPGDTLVDIAFTNQGATVAALVAAAFPLA